MRGKLYEPKRGDYILLTVIDTGTGMDRDTMERVFDPFFTTKEMGRGTGLGLASAYGIIKGHGGYIDVESVKEKGTTFSIYLPASEKRVQKVVKTAEEVIRGTETVLLVDDEEASSLQETNLPAIDTCHPSALITSKCPRKASAMIYDDGKRDHVCDILLLS